MCQNVKNEKGMTLLEILIVIAILSFVFVSVFQILTMNYDKMHDELVDQSERSNFRITISYMMQDIPYSDYVSVDNQPSFDALTYRDYKGEYQILKFAHNDGLYEIDDGVEKLIAKGVAFDTTKPMVRMENNMVIINFYAEEINALLELSMKSRIQP